MKKTFMGKTIAIVAGLMMVGGIALADAEWENTSNATADQSQTQTDETNLYNHHGDSIGSQSQDAWGIINTYGNASGSYGYHQDQQDSYDETKPSVNGLGFTQHSGYSDNYTNVNGNTSDWWYGGSHSNSNAHTDSNSSTNTSDSGPESMHSDATQHSNANVRGYASTDWYGSASNSASAGTHQEDGYVNERETANTYTKHEGSSVQELYTGGNASTNSWYGYAGYSASATADQTNDTDTNQTHGSNWDSMSGSQDASSVDTNNSNSYNDSWYNNSYSGAGSGVGQIQTHSYEMESYNPSSNSNQYSTGTVTTGTGYDPTEECK